MTEHVNFLLLGLANGAVFAALGLALTVTFRSSNVMNFATSAMALFTAYIYAGLRRGELLILVPGLPASVDMGGPLSFVPAAVLALTISAVLGLVMYVVVFRPLRSASVIAKAVASLGVMVVMTGVIVQRQGTRPPPVDRILPTDRLSVGDVSVSRDRVYFALSVVALAIVVWALTRFTRFGLKTRAASESEKGAYLAGLSPDRIAAMNWMLSAVVCGAAGILIAPIVPLVPLQYTLFIVPALATGILGRFERLGPAVIGGLAVGMLQSEAGYLRVQHSWLPGSGLAELVPLALIMVVLVARARPLPSRGVILHQALGSAPRPRSIGRPALLGAVAAAAALALLSGSSRAALITSLILAIITLSYVVVTGYTGQISLAQLTLAGVAGFIVAPLSTGWRLPLAHATIPFPLAPVVAALAATVVGVVFGLPALRVRGVPLAVVTLALAVALEAAWFRNPDIVPSTGFDVHGPKLFGLDLSIGSGLDYPRPAFGFLVLAVLVAVGVGVAKLRTSRLGSAMLAVRANERSAAAAGVNVVLTKLAAFAIGSFTAGLGGALLAYKLGNVTFASFTVFLGLSVFATAYLAGVTSVTGGIVAGLVCAGGLVFTTLDSHFSLGRWYSTIAGVGLIIAVIRFPDGYVGPIHRWLEQRRQARLPSVLAPDASTGPRLATSYAPSTSTASLSETTSLLELRDVSIHYRGVCAVEDVSFAVPKGRIVGLIGPNGAGKTTILDAISGFTPASGQITLGGRDLARLKPYQRSRAGIGRTFQSLDLYDDMTVAENVVVGATADRHTRSPFESTTEILTLLGLDEDSERSAGELSQGARQLVSIARVLAGQPDLLLLDEPAAGLDTTESRWLGDRLRELRDNGHTILLVDHDMHLVLDLCDEIQVLDFGRLIASGQPAAIRSDRTVSAAYLGNVHGESTSADLNGTPSLTQGATSS
ncbi:MAG: branched-chain amino acid ABC transporter permease/ATP-binding protein [Actinomycetota bacterium]|nr:branched-chain amino acid ABC transporter permease/ATP-binding protein [Actinomycetota bacterium]